MSDASTRKIEASRRDAATRVATVFSRGLRVEDFEGGIEVD